jgi:hypothetical protein
MTDERFAAVRTADEAAHAYNKAANQLRGKFATLNPVGVDPRAEVKS